MSLCQDAPRTVCQTVWGLEGCDCPLCKKLASGRWWYAAGCGCVACGVARGLEAHVFAKAVLHPDLKLRHRPRFDDWFEGNDLCVGVEYGPGQVRVVRVQQP